MRALKGQPQFYGWVGMLLLGCTTAACDNGLVQLSLLSAAGGSPDASTEAGRGGSGAAGASGESRPGIGMPRWPYLCEAEWEPEQEKALGDALSDAFDSGRFCPRAPPQQQRPLMADPELQWQARSSLCLPTERNWIRASRSPVFVWSVLGTPNLEDAKKALLGSEHDQLCEEAAGMPPMPFRFVGVGHAMDAWSVFIAPGFPEDMQKP